MKTRVGRSSYWPMEKVEMPSLNSNKMHLGDNSKLFKIKDRNLFFKGEFTLATRVIYSEERFLRKTMLADEQEGFDDEQGFSGEARTRADRVPTPIGTAMHLAAKHPSWTGEDFGETIYVFALWILRRFCSDSKGNKISRRGLVGQELEMPLVDKGGRLGDNIYHAMVDGDERILLATCICQPSRNLRNAHGAESRNKKSEAQVGDLGYRKCRPGKSSNKCAIGCD